jgi:hypothetical protein
VIARCRRKPLQLRALPAIKVSHVGNSVWAGTHPARWWSRIQEACLNDRRFVPLRKQLKSGGTCTYCLAGRSVHLKYDRFLRPIAWHYVAARPARMIQILDVLD